jgi:dipeptidyl aminopeptidase/acylaminoacyl peptidase
MADAQLQSALAHWAPRLIANGIPLADFQDVTASLESWEGWCRAWVARGEVHEQLGEADLARGWRLSAGEHFTRAAVCHHFAKFVFVEDLEQMRWAHLKAVAARRRALPLIAPPGEAVEIPYLGGALKGELRRPEGGDRPPVVVMCMGLDSCKEEMDAYERNFLDRGMATLAFDGPGQGEAEYDHPIRGDYEVPVAAVFDWLQTRSDIDASRAALWGVSLGGYYAPRAAAFEKRARACIALSGPYDMGANWDGLPALTRRAFQVRAKCATEAEARAHASTLSLAGLASRIECPLFVVAGKQDRIIPWQDAERLAREAKGPVEFLLVEDGNHVVNNRAYRYRSQTADWMAAQLGLPPR